MKLSKRIERIDSSGIRRVFALASQIKSPVDLSIGQPDFDVPKSIKRAAIASIENGFNHYTPTNGIIELREAVSRKLYQKNNIKVSPDDVLITSGTSGGIYLALSSLLDPGDEVIILDPYFVMYKQLVIFLGAVPKIVSTYPDFQPNIIEIEKTISKKTKLIILNSPNNPTGAVYKEKTIREIVNLAKKHDIPILSDEVYEDFIYKGKHFGSASIYKNTITLNGFSKSAAMTGWRIGYAAGPKEIINQMAKLQQYTFVCAPSFAQKAAIQALETDNKSEIQRYKENLDLLIEGLKDKYQIVKPEGAFYLFLKTPIQEGKFVQKLLDNKVIVVPGSIFSNKPGYFRISFATSEETIRRAIEIFCKLA